MTRRPLSIRFNVRLDPFSSSGYLHRVACAVLFFMAWGMLMGPEAFGQDWKSSGSDLYYDDGKVGVGTSSPAKKLHVKNGSVAIAEDHSLILADHLPHSRITAKKSSVDGKVYIEGQNGVVLQSYEGATSTLHTDLLARYGKVGIGTTSPSHKLQVGGSARAEDFIPDNGHYFPNRETSDYTSAMKGHNYTYLMWDRNNGGGPFETYDRPQFMYWDNDGEGTLHYLIDSGNMENLNARFATLEVKGDVLAEEVVVALSEDWPDFVFSDEYRLPTLREVARHIDEQGHLPDIPSAGEVAADGVRLGEMDAKLLQKIEELTLYTIEQQEQNRALQQQVAGQQQQLDAQQQEIDQLKRMIEAVQDEKR